MIASKRPAALSYALRTSAMIATLVLIAGLSYWVTLFATGDSSSAVRRINPGDTLDNVSLLTMVDDKPAGVVPLLQAFEPGCGIMVFFHSECPFCETMTKEWARITAIWTPLGEVPVVWTAASVADTGAAAFVHLHNLPRQWYAIATNRDRQSLGVEGWPTLYLVSSGGRFEGEIKLRDPQSMVMPATNCLQSHSPAATTGSPPA